jgi:hypothetical protein
VHGRVAAAATVLARHEMAEIGALEGSPRLAAARRLGPRLLCYYAQEDHWNLPGDAERAALLLPRARVVSCTEGHSHSFVLQERSVEAMAATTWAFVEAALREKGGVGGGERAATEAEAGSGGGGGRRVRRGSAVALL